MNMKKKVMRRLSALLIVSMVWTGSAFSTMAANISYYDIKESSSSTQTQTLQVGNKTTLKVQDVTLSTRSDAIGIATSSNALKDNLTWVSSDESIVKILEDNDSDVFTCLVEAESEGTAIITAVSEGTNVDDKGIEGKDFKSTEITFSITVTAAESEAVTTIELSPKELSVEVGKAADITATVKENGEEVNNREITWSSSDDTIATVEGGKVTGVKAGAATITAKVKGKDAIDTCKVIVKAASTSEEVETTVELSPKELSVEVGKIADITATVKEDGEEVNNREIIWSSSDDTVATVEGGKVTGVKAGAATITAKVKDRDATATCKVIVKAAPEVKIELKLDQEKVVVPFEGKVELKATVIKDNKEVSNPEIKWTSSDKAIATVDKGVITGVKAGGTATITAEVEIDGKKATAICEVSVALPVSELPEKTDEEIAKDLENIPGLDISGEKLQEAIDSVNESTAKVNDSLRNLANTIVEHFTSVTKKLESTFTSIAKALGFENRKLSLNVSKATHKRTEIVLNKDGKPIVVIPEMTYNISLVDQNNTELTHDDMKDNETAIEFNIPLPTEGIHESWKWAKVTHRQGNGKNIIFKSPIKDGSIKIKAWNFSEFDLEFFEENAPELNGIKDINDIKTLADLTGTTTTTPSGSSSGGGSGSRSRVSSEVGSNASQNRYAMTGNWTSDANGWKFVKSNGETAANTWGWINNQYYYFDAAGKMVTGWTQVDGKWYYLNPTGTLQGAMLTGVIFDQASNAYFYTDASGAMVTGWQQINEKWYYFSPVSDGVYKLGQLLAGTYIDGYYLGADGAMVPAN